MSSSSFNRGGSRRVLVSGSGSASGTLNDRFTQMKDTKVGISSPGFKKRRGSSTSITISRDDRRSGSSSVGRQQHGGGSRQQHGGGGSRSGGRGGSRGGRSSSRGGSRGGRGGRGGRFKREKTPTKEELDAELDEISKDNQMKE